MCSPIRAPVHHPYEDGRGIKFDTLAYAYEEIFAEKVRALAERTRPRDLYDVVSLFRNTELRPSAPVLQEVLTQECRFKNISVPTLSSVEQNKSALSGSWNSMLAHQLPALPESEVSPGPSNHIHFGVHRKETSSCMRGMLMQTVTEHIGLIG